VQQGKEQTLLLKHTYPTLIIYFREHVPNQNSLKHRRQKMKLSARNQFAGKVAKVEEGAVNGIVTIDVKGTPVTATISMNAIKELGLAEGKDAVAVIKATEVMVATGGVTLSARNKFAGKIAAVEKGAVNDIVKIDTAFGTVSATISDSAVAELGLEAGKDAVAVVKATSVMVGVE
jgi:molybdate transport system regulatory protein